MIYTNKNINLISFVITIIIFFISNFLFFKIPEVPVDNISNIISNIDLKKEDEVEKNEQKIPVNLGDWYIEIPSINLKAPIAEGTSNEILQTKVGHFENTSLENGNVGLAAHNRGYEYNFFENLKNVKIDDKIIYTYKEYSKTYIVDTIEIIKNSDWSYLEKTDENKITLITCVENEPKYRRCVQAVELEI